MGRHVVSVPRRYKTFDALRRETAWEMRLSNIYIVSTAAFALGCLSFTPMIPYASHHRWAFFAGSGAMMSLLNLHDLTMMVHIASRGLSLDDGELLRSIMNSDTASVFMVALGSILLFNAALIGIFKSGEDSSCRLQFGAAFSLFIVGYACNMISHRESTTGVLETRNAVVFQMSLASTLNLVGALTAASELDGSDALRNPLQAWMHGIGGSLALLASFFNRFHTRAFMINEEILFQKRKYASHLAVIAKVEEKKEVRDQPPTTMLQQMLRGISTRITAGICSKLGYSLAVNCASDGRISCEEYYSSSSEPEDVSGEDEDEDDLYETFESEDEASDRTIGIYGSGAKMWDSVKCKEETSAVTYSDEDSRGAGMRLESSDVETNTRPAIYQNYSSRRDGGNKSHAHLSRHQRGHRDYC
jgi:hypothetical protein